MAEMVRPFILVRGLERTSTHRQPENEKGTNCKVALLHRTKMTCRKARKLKRTRAQARLGVEWHTVSTSCGSLAIDMHFFNNH